MIKVFKVIMRAYSSANILKFTMLNGYIIIHSIVIAREAVKMLTVKYIYLYSLGRAYIKVGHLTGKGAVGKGNIFTCRNLCVMGIIIIEKFYVLNKYIIAVAKAQNTGFISVIVTVECSVFNGTLRK